MAAVPLVDPACYRHQRCDPADAIKCERMRQVQASRFMSLQL
jgi:hypothetical protein